MVCRSIVFQILVTMAWLGCVTGVAVTFLVTLIGPANIILALMAAFTVACPSVMVVGMLPMIGKDMEVSSIKFATVMQHSIVT